MTLKKYLSWSALTLVAMLMSASTKPHSPGRSEDQETPIISWILQEKEGKSKNKTKTRTNKKPATKITIARYMHLFQKIRTLCDNPFIIGNSRHYSRK